MDKNSQTAIILIDGGWARILSNPHSLPIKIVDWGEIDYDHEDESGARMDTERYLGKKAYKENNVVDVSRGHVTVVHELPGNHIELKIIN